MNNRKFVAKINDIKLTVRKADAFTINYVNCKKDKFKIEDNKDNIKLVQIEKGSYFYWFRLLTKGSPEVIVTLPENVNSCEIEAKSNQVLIEDVKMDKIYAEVHNGMLEVRNVKANDIFLKCFNGSAIAKNVKVANVCTIDTLNGTSVLEGAITKDAGLEVACKNGVMEVSEKYRAILGYKKDGCANYVLHCQNGKAIVK